MNASSLNKKYIKVKNQNSAIIAGLYMEIEGDIYKYSPIDLTKMRILKEKEIQYYRSIKADSHCGLLYTKSRSGNIRDLDLSKFVPSDNDGFHFEYKGSISDFEI